MDTFLSTKDLLVEFWIVMLILNEVFTLIVVGPRGIPLLLISDLLCDGSRDAAKLDWIPYDIDDYHVKSCWFW